VAGPSGFVRPWVDSIKEFSFSMDGLIAHPRSATKDDDGCVRSAVDFVRGDETLFTHSTRWTMADERGAVAQILAKRTGLPLEVLAADLNRLERHLLDAFDQQEDEEEPQKSSRAQDGATFILDGPKDTPSVWGRDDQVLWAAGETLMLVGPQGVGKSTLLQQLSLARIGLREEVLGYAIGQTSSHVLYIAADRPAQIRRSFFRMVTEADRAVLTERLMVWAGPLPFDLAAQPEKLLAFVQQFDADTLVIDSLKDVAFDLPKDEVGVRVNHALQLVLSAGIEIVVAHHQRKATAQNKKPSTLGDVYGSVWLTAGCGSVVLLWGEAGDPVIELSHLKQPVSEVGPLKMLHDHDHGSTALSENPDLLDVLRKRGSLTAEQAARVLFDRDTPSESQIEKARRRMGQLTRKGLALERTGQRGGSKDERVPTTWLALDLTVNDPWGNHESNHAPNFGAPNHATTEQSRLDGFTHENQSREQSRQTRDPNHVFPPHFSEGKRVGEGQSGQQLYGEEALDEAEVRW